MGARDQTLENLVLEFSSKGERQETSFVQICVITRRILSSYLQGKMCFEDAEDIIEQAFAKIWHRRDKIHFPSSGHWLAYVKLVVDRLRIDHARGNVTLNGLDDSFLENISSSEKSTFTDAIIDELQRQDLKRAADDLWLGERANNFKIRLLAAKMIYWDNLSLEDICTLISTITDDEQLSSPQNLLEWITDVSVIRTLGFEALFLPPSKLSSYVLGCDEEHLALMVPHVSNPDSTFWQRNPGESLEMQIAIWKFYFFEPTHEIVHRLRERVAEAGIIEVIDSYTACLPFLDTMSRLSHELSAEVKATALSESKLWKRVAFEYSSLALPHSDFLKWFCPVASSVDFDLTPMTLHAWISNKRLIKELTRFMQNSSMEASCV